MEERRIEDTGSNVIKDILFAIKRNIILVALILIICAGCGFGYSYIKKPDYTAGENVVYMAKEVNSQSGTASSINIMRAYFNTVVDFCDEGVVTDRANFYYVMYKNKAATTQNYTVDRFIKDDLSYYEGHVTLGERSYILKNKISVTADVSSADSDQFSFVIKYTDSNRAEAKDKVKLLVEAIKSELKMDNNVNTYFDTIENQFISLGSTGTSSNISKSRFTIIGLFIGAILAAAIVYIKTLLDNTITSKEHLEELTGAPVLSVINKEGGRK